jgi:CHAD domain-containing protein
MNPRTGRATSRLLLRRAQALRRHLPQAVAGEHTGVHRARVATRRLREAVPVLSTGLKHSKARKARRKIRRLTRALGAVRELDVTLHLVDGLMHQSDLPRNALEEVRRHVVEERDRRREVMLERLERVDLDKLGRRLDSVAEALDGAGEEAWRPVLAARIAGRATRLEEAAAHAGKMYAPERLHDVRIAAKKLRYALELAADSGTRSAAPLVRRIKRLQDLLGCLHDVQVLQEHVAAVQAGPAASRPGMHEGLELVARHVEAECRHLHGRYLASAPSIQDVTDAARSKVLPEVERRRGRRPLKMTLQPGVRRRPRPAAAGGRR